MTKIDRLVAVNSNLAEAKALAEKMTTDERNIFAQSLTAMSAAKQTSSPEHRLGNVKAAAQDPKKKEAYYAAISSLRRLGFEIDQIAASGSTKDLEAVMKERGWDMTRRIFLKSNLLAIGAIA